MINIRNIIISYIKRNESVEMGFGGEKAFYFFTYEVKNIVYFRIIQTHTHTHTHISKRYFFMFNTPLSIDERY